MRGSRHVLNFEEENMLDPLLSFVSAGYFDASCAAFNALRAVPCIHISV